MPEAYPTPETSPEIAERNLLNVAIWQRIFELVDQSPNRQPSFPYDRLSTSQDTLSHEFEVNLRIPKITARAEPVDAIHLRGIEFIQSQKIERTRDHVAGIIFAETKNWGEIDFTFGLCRVYNLYADGWLIKNMLWAGSDEPIERTNQAVNISNTERQELLTELLALESIV